MTRRLAVLLSLIVSLLWLATTFIAYSVIKAETDEIYAEVLAKTAYRLMPLVIDALGEKSDAAETSRHPAGAVDDLGFFSFGAKGFLAYEVRDRQGEVVLRSYDARQYQLPTRVRPGFHKSADLLTFTVTDGATGLSLTVVEPAEHRREALDEALVALLAPLLLLIPLIIAAVVMTTRFALLPIGVIRDAISTRGGSNFDPIDGSTLPRELRPVAQSVDRLLDRLNAVLGSERALTAESAHELRTPLAGALAQTRRLRQEISGGPGHERVVEVENSLQRLADFIEKLIQLSRFGAGTKANARVNLTPVLSMIVHDFAKRAEATGGIEVDNRLLHDLTVAMDPDAFALAMRNLLENAIVHSGGTGLIRVLIDVDWTVHVINGGAVVTAPYLAALRERFRRGETEAAGSGLGLAIVDRIMTSCGGTLHLHSPAIGAEEGFEAILQLP